MVALTEVSETIALTIHKGDTTDIVYVRPSLLDGATLDGNWTCSQAVTKDGTQVITTVAVTTKSTDNTEFKCFLTPTQTDTLTVGEHIWTIQLANPTLTPAIIKEIQLRMSVTTDYI